jgi:hypothetical protein
MDENKTSQPNEAELERRRALRDRHAHDLLELVARRRELIGINRWADQVIEGVAWTA